MSCRVRASRRQFATAIGGRRCCRGAALLMTMFLVALIGILLTVAGQVWHTERQREKEAELLAVGGEYARAIARYYAASPPRPLQYPEKLNELLLDTRQPITVRHLRRLYRDPLTGSSQWGLIKDASGRITGVLQPRQGRAAEASGFRQSASEVRWRQELR